MNPQNERPPVQSLNPPPSLLPVVPLAEKTAPTIASDRLYQLAALTAGVFLLATLL